MTATEETLSDDAAAAIAERVVAYREAHGLARRDLAELMGVSTAQVTRLENADRLPSISTLARLAGVLDLELAISISPVGGKPRLLRKKAKSWIVGESAAPTATVRLAARGSGS